MPKKNESAAGKKVPATKRVPSKKASAKTGTAKKKPAAAESAVAAKRAKKPAGTVRAKAKKAAAPVEKIGHGMDLVRRCVAALEEKKARDVEVIRVGESSSVTDYYVLATGTSDPHLRSIRIELEKAIDAVVPEGTVRIQNEPGSGWCVVDAFDVVVHVFAAEQRARYNLEELYASGEKISLE
ncbi:MAG: ribosome silencing factor [Candidatus Spyradosoma sp.]